MVLLLELLSISGGVYSGYFASPPLANTDHRDEGENTCADRILDIDVEYTEIYKSARRTFQLLRHTQAETLNRALNK